jgi:parallel beta-helix repeat protein
MSKKAVFTVLLLFFLVLTNVRFVKSARASRTWTVDDDGPADFHTVQEAVDAASSGDTVFVHSGIYHEYTYTAESIVSIAKAISLVGENPFDTIIDANFSSRTAILIRTDYVTVRNLTVRNSAYSHWHWDSTGGIYLDQSNGCIVENCIVTGNQNGINLQVSGGNNVSHNLVTDNVWGIKVGDSSNNNLIEGNLMLNNSYYGYSMVIDWDTNNNTIADNCFYNRYNSLDPRPNSLIIHSPATGVVYHNDFMNNLPAVIDAGLPGLNFTLSKDGEGNFWIDYTGVDADEDGLGDTPYAIQYATTYGNASDIYPLMKPYKWLQGDVNYDMVVKILDISIIAKAFGSSIGDAKWNPRCDLNNDKTINILDISVAAANFRKKMSWQPI